MEETKETNNNTEKKEGFLDEIVLEFKKFGMDEKILIESFIPLVIKLFDELRRETFRFEGEQKRISKIKNEVLPNVRNLILQNISSTRNFLLSLVTFSLTVSGVFISAIVSSRVDISGPVIFGAPLAYLGLVSLAVSIMTAVWYLTFIHVREGEELRNYLCSQEEIFKDFDGILEKFYKDRQSFDEYLNERHSLYDKKL
jgi:hypothetical protein